MKKAVLGMILVLLLAQSVLGVTIGGPETERGKQISEDFLLKNNEGVLLENIDFITTAIGFNIEIENLPSTLAIDEEVELVLNAEIPDDFDAVDEFCNAQAFDIGKLSFSADGVGVFEEIDLAAQAKNHLDLEKLILRVGDEGQIVEANTIYKDIFPGDDLELIARVRNTFKDITKIEAEFSADHPDDIDLEREDESANIKDGGRIDLQLDGEITIDAKSTQDLTARVCGEDDNGALHGESLAFVLDVERKRHHLRILDFESSTEIIQCNRNVNFNTEVVNVGNTLEKEARVVIEQADLEITRSQTFQLDEDQKKRVPISFTIPSTTVPGPYEFVVTTQFAGKFPSDEERKTLQVLICEKDTVPVREVTLSPPEPVIVNPVPVEPVIEEPAQVIEEPVVITPEQSNNLGFVVILGAVIMGLMLGAVLAYFFRK